MLPLARVKFCRDKTGTIDNLSGLSGKCQQQLMFLSRLRQSDACVSHAESPIPLCFARFGSKNSFFEIWIFAFRSVKVPYYDFERKIGSEAEYLHEQLARLHEADNGNVNSIYHDLAREEHQAWFRILWNFSQVFDQNFVKRFVFVKIVLKFLTGKKVLWFCGTNQN